MLDRWYLQIYNISPFINVAGIKVGIEYRVGLFVAYERYTNKAKAIMSNLHKHKGSKWPQGLYPELYTFSC